MAIGAEYRGIDLVRPKKIPISFREASALVVARVGGGDGEERVAVDRSYFRRLDLPVGFVILNNAQRINPEVPDAEPARNSHGVSKSPGHC